jgi:nucleoside-diphosphate-sugar epimerase
VSGDGVAPGRALVVGVTGISGGNLARRLLADGWEVTGWLEVTISRGEIVALGNDVRAAPGRGRLAARGPHQPL